MHSLPAYVQQLVQKSAQRLLVGLILAQLSGCLGAAVVGGGAVLTKQVVDGRSIKEQCQDTMLKGQLLGLLNTRLKAAENPLVQISVAVYKGHALVVGQLPDVEMKSKINEAVRTLTGLQGFYNKTEHKPPLSFAQRVTDSAMTSLLSTRILAIEPQSLKLFKLVAEDGELFVLGHLSLSLQKRIAGEAKKCPNTRRLTFIEVSDN